MEAYEYATMRHIEDDYWWYRGLRRLVQDSARRCFGDRPWRVLDAGCGTGGQIEALKPHFPAMEVWGIDISSLAVGFTRSRGVRTLALATALRLPFPSACFDAVFSLDILQSRGLRLSAGLHELARVLRPGGYLFLNLPAFASLAGQHDLAVNIERRYLLPEVLAAVSATDLRPVRAFYWDVALFPLAYLLRRLRRAGSPETPTSDLFMLPTPLNWLLTRWILFEVRLARRVRFPFGTSVFVLAQRRAH
jgi:ubiquinone/menaquinone biosynthesis C-methylase UbiE